LWVDPTCTILRENRCCSTESLLDAREVASLLGIPFYVIDVAKEFKRTVVDYFLEEYGFAKTPNPCVVCNRQIKFGLLLEKARKLGADFLATGHYARIKSQTKGNRKKDVVYHLLRGKDLKKDQSYMLWMLGQNDLRQILFPLGEMRKEQVRHLALKWKLPVAEKPESQEVCFVGDKDYREFLKRYIPEKIKPGKIVNLEGQVVGKHQGLPLYTVGQRKGIVTTLKSAGGKTHPFYVVGANADKNELIIGREKDLYKKEMVVEKVNWILNSPKFPFSCKVQIRYKHEAVPCKVEAVSPQCLKVLFAKPQRAVTPGQSAVFYRGNEVLGGGIIK